MGLSGRSPLSHHKDVPHTEAEFLDVIETKVSLDSFPPALPWDYQGDHLSLYHHTDAAYRGRILRRNWDKSLNSFPPALPWDYQGDHLSPHHTDAAYRGPILGRN
jgi:hypothetical protein